MKTIKKEEISYKEFTLQKTKMSGLKFVSTGNNFAPELSKEFSYSYKILKGETEVAYLDAAMFKLFEEEYEEKEELIAEMDYLIGQMEETYSSDACLLHESKKFILDNKSWNNLNFFILQEIEVRKEFEGKGLGAFLFQEFMKDNLSFTSHECLGILPGVISGRCGRFSFPDVYELDTDDLLTAKEALINNFYLPQLQKTVANPKLIATKHYRYIYC